MYLLYLDESGDPYGWNTQRHFVVGGVAVHEGQVYRLAKALDGIQQTYFPKIKIPLKLHASEIRGGKGPHFKTLTPSVREMLLSDIYDLIYRTRFPKLVAFATGINITAVKDPSRVLSRVFEDLCERFDTLLIRQGKAGLWSKGLLIIDQAHEERYRSLVREFQVSGTRHRAYLGNVIDIPYFAGGSDTRMLQLADHVAYSVFRYFEYADDAYFKRVLPRFDKRGPRLPPDGLKHITNELCECAACEWRKASQ
jgi:hypothetical protein